MSGLSLHNLAPRYHNVLLLSKDQKSAQAAQQALAGSGRNGPPGSVFDISNDQQTQNVRKWGKIARQLAGMLEANPFASQTCQRMRIRYAHLIPSMTSTNTAFDMSEFEEEWNRDAKRRSERRTRTRGSLQKAMRTLSSINRFSMEFENEDAPQAYSYPSPRSSVTSSYSHAGTPRSSGSMSPFPSERTPSKVPSSQQPSPQNKSLRTSSSDKHPSLPATIETSEEHEYQRNSSGAQLSRTEPARRPQSSFEGNRFWKTESTG